MIVRVLVLVFLFLFKLRFPEKTNDVGAVKCLCRSEKLDFKIQKHEPYWKFFQIFVFFIFFLNFLNYQIIVYSIQENKNNASQCY